MKEIPYTWASSAGLGWAIAWRTCLVSIPPALAFNWVRSAAPEWQLVLPFLELAVLVVSFLVASHWLRAHGFGSVKIVLVEWADYQKAKASEGVQLTVQPDGAPPAGPQVNRGVAPDNQGQ